jgi:hypothetical protein
VPGVHARRPGERRHHRDDAVRDEGRGAHQAAPHQGAVHDQGQAHAEHELDRHRDDRDEHGRPERRPPVDEDRWGAQQPAQPAFVLAAFARRGRAGPGAAATPAPAGVDAVSVRRSLRRPSGYARRSLRKHSLRVLFRCTVESDGRPCAVPFGSAGRQRCQQGDGGCDDRHSRGSGSTQPPCPGIPHCPAPPRKSAGPDTGSTSTWHGGGTRSTALPAGAVRQTRGAHEFAQDAAVTRLTRICAWVVACRA